MIDAAIFLLRILTGKIGSVLYKADDMSMNPLQIHKSGLQLELGLIRSLFDHLNLPLQ